jgi:hypothetical protein
VIKNLLRKGIPSFYKGRRDLIPSVDTMIGSKRKMKNPHDERYEFCTEEIFDCMSSGVPHQHAVNRIIARKEITTP